MPVQEFSTGNACSAVEPGRIRTHEMRDWSRQTMADASIDFLDKDALALARRKYKEHAHLPGLAEEVDGMTDEQFLTMLRLMRGGKLTNAAMVLLGNEDYDYLFSTPPEISWRLFDSRGCIRDYAIFKTPFLTAGERAAEKIRNLTCRYMPDQRSLFTTAALMYDAWLLRELQLHCPL